MKTNPSPYHGYRHPCEIISHAVWLYHRFTLSFRDVEEILASRGIEVSYESIRQWCLHFCQDYAKKIRARQGRVGDSWYLDEVFIKIKGKQHYLWRAVDQDGDTLDILVQSRRNKRAAKKFFRKLLKGLKYCPNRIVTDKLKSYGAAIRETDLDVEHDTRQYQNNRAENSHQRSRQQERQMRRFKSPGHAQRFLSVHGPINNLSRQDRHLMSASSYRELRNRGFAEWRKVTGTASWI
ncbi:IS6 family transposase [Magnetofaba australis]|uniref:IS6 family transposase n=1 Tax=Magnetofaba australis TaxID=1472297 RepID=UPI000A19F2E1|nr:IS6 family transposase [Magnetofaba australis]